MKRLLFDCAVVLLAAAGAYRWTHRPVPTRPPAIRGARPNLDMPPPSGLTSPQALDSGELVVPESAGDDRPHLAGSKQPRREPGLGDTPQILGEPAIDVTAAGASDGAPADDRSPWEDRLRKPWAFGAVVALFIVLYALGTRALRRGPGGRGFTRD
jgi:uncharacterized iron-regulated membrane protein